MARTNEVVSAGLTAVLVVSAIVMTVTAVRHEFFPSRSLARGLSAPGQPVPVPNWEDYLVPGHMIGDAAAAVKVLEFADFQCPACREFALETFPALQRRYPNEVALVFRHWPLDYHPMALSAARGAECAAEQGRFERFHDLLYQLQDSIRTKPLVSFAAEAGVPNRLAFETCISRTDLDSLIEQDARAARSVGGTGTPTIVVQGLLLPTPPDSVELIALVRSVLDKLKK